MVNKLYDKSFYENVVNAGALRSAELIVPVVLEECTYGVQRVVDVGCGEGIWTSVFAARGLDVIGVDGDHVDRSRLQIDPGAFFARELDRAGSLTDVIPADLAVSLEVAEHLPPSRAESFIEELCDLAPQILFSAAIPGQGGVGHVNERWPSYWADLFRDNGYVVTGALRFMFWEAAMQGLCENWYCQNLLLAVRDDFYDANRQWFGNWFEGLASLPIPLVHPVLFTHIRSLLG